VQCEAGNTTGGRIAFHGPLRHSLGQGRGGFAQQSLGLGGLFLGDGGLDFFHQTLHAIHRDAVSLPTPFGLAGSSNRRFVNHRHLRSSKKEADLYHRTFEIVKAQAVTGG